MVYFSCMYEESVTKDYASKVKKKCPLKLIFHHLVDLILIVYYCWLSPFKSSKFNTQTENYNVTEIITYNKKYM